jgi:hypothetical protein
MPRELGLVLGFKINTSQKCFVVGDFVFTKKRKKHWNIGTLEQWKPGKQKNQTNPFWILRSKALPIFKGEHSAAWKGS